MNQIRLVAYPDGSQAKAINIPETSSQKPPSEDEKLIMLLDDEIQRLRAELDEMREAADAMANAIQEASDYAPHWSWFTKGMIELKQFRAVLAKYPAHPETKEEK